MHNKSIITNKIVQGILEVTITEDVPVVIGVSGGPDSMYLLDQLKTFWTQKGYTNENLNIVSCNHNTRKNIDQEIQLVQSASVGYYFATASYTGKDISEQSLRKRRHKVFVDHCDEKSAKLLLLGHHLNDRIETTLLNIQRGCGIQGIQSFGVREAHFLDPTIAIIRPLITCTKEDILTACKEGKIPYSIDPTNADTSVSKRNFIRNLIEHHLQKNNIIESLQRLYTFFDSHEKLGGKKEGTLGKVSIIPLQNGMDLINICAGERNESSLYDIFKSYHISINPRSTTLHTLSQQLSASGKKIIYQGLEITAYKYGTTIKSQKVKSI